MPRSALRLSIGAALFAGLAFCQCEAPANIKMVVDAYNASTRTQGSQSEKKAAGAAILDPALAEHPTDYFLLDRKRDLLDDNSSAGREASLAWFGALHRKYPDSPEVTAVFADVLKAKDAAQALSLLEASFKAHADFPWTHYKLFPFFESGKFRNADRLVKEVDALLSLCPKSANAYMYRVLMSAATPEQIGPHAKALREQLEPAAETPNQQLWTVLWDLEFKAVPPTEHAAVRERIRKDLARFEESPQRGVAFLAFLKKGYSNVGDKAAVERIDGQILNDFPNSGEAERITADRWNADYKFPKDGDHAAQQAFYRLQAATMHEWYQRWHSLIVLMQEFNAVAALDDTKPEELLKLAQQYVDTYQKSPNSFYGAMPIEFEVADALIRKKSLPADIPAWMEEGFRRESNRPSRLTGMVRDQLSDEMKKMVDQQMVSMRIERARILLAYYDAVGQREKSLGIDDGLAGLNPPDDRLKPELFQVRAKAAEMSNRKLDALVLYQAARAMGGKPVGRTQMKPEELDQKIAQLWKDLGGTSAAAAVFSGRQSLEPVSEIRWESPRNPLPAFTLTDLAGKTWKLTDLNGKATLINVWATWCGPCRAEHPEFQKLYEKLKDRADITVLSLNVDEEAGLVAPYMTDNHYTFPVVLGKDLLRAVSGDDGVAIPQNWFVAPSAKLSTLQLGYGGDPKWQETMIGKLDELLKGK
jgi:thiol-disulfide isomerase/thioredoxin